MIFNGLSCLISVENFRDIQKNASREKSLATVGSEPRFLCIAKRVFGWKIFTFLRLTPQF